MTWNMQGVDACTIVPQAGISCAIIYILSVAIELFKGKGTMVVQLHCKEGMHLYHDRIEELAKSLVADGTFSRYIGNICHPLLNEMRLEFEREKGKMFTFTAIEKFLRVMEVLKARTRKNLGWPHPHVVLETFAHNGFMPYGVWLTRQFGPRYLEKQ